MGQLYIAELVALLALPFVGWSKTLRLYPELRAILAGYIISATGLIISDIINGTPIDAAMRGAANYAFAVTTLLFILSILRQSMAVVAYVLLGAAISCLFFTPAVYQLSGSEAELSLSAIEENINFFKVRFVPLIVPALLLLSIYLYQLGRLPIILLLGAWTVICFLFDARSAALISGITASILAIQMIGLRISWRTLMALALPGMLAGQVGYMAYVDYALKHNPSGHNGLQLARLENPYNPLELLLQGRSEWTVAIDAISDKPLFGHGSWAYDYEGRYAAIRAQRASTMDQFLRAEQRREGYWLVPAHSVLLGSVIWAGLLGLAGFMIVFSTAIRLGRRVLAQPSTAFAVVAIFQFVQFFWDALFSPLQAIRLSFPLALAVLLLVSRGWTTASAVPPFRHGREN